jgi:hypothetical protein
MAITRACEQCGTQFTPRREHSRFCSGRCRVAWNSAHARHAGVSSAALDWSLTAMTEATARLARSRPPGAGTAVAHAAVAVSEAVWWVTIVDATLVRYHPDSYDTTIDGLPAAQREEIEQTLAGLRFVRNQMGIHLDPSEFIGALPDPGRHRLDGRRPGGHVPGSGDRRAAVLAWSPLAPPADRDLSPSGQEWERGRYLAYTERLAGQDVAYTFALAARFLRHAAASAAAAAQADGPAADGAGSGPGASSNPGASATPQR